MKDRVTKHGRIKRNLVKDMVHLGIGDVHCSCILFYMFFARTLISNTIRVPRVRQECLRTLKLKHKEFLICHVLANFVVFCSNITILIHVTVDFPIRHSTKTATFREFILKIAIYVLS